MTLNLFIMMNDKDNMITSSNIIIIYSNDNINIIIIFIFIIIILGHMHTKSTNMHANWET